MNIMAAPAWLARVFLCVAVAMGVVSLAHAQSRLDKVLKEKKMVLGFQEGTHPIGFLDEKGNMVGWSVDLSKAIHKAIEAKYGATIDLEFKPVNPQTRIPLVVNGTLDFVLGSTGKTIEREQVVDFSLINAGVCVNMLYRKKSPIKSYADLGGKRVGVTSGGVEERVLTEMGKTGKIKPPPKLVTFPSHANGFLALDQGKTDVHVTNAPALIGLKQSAKNPDDWVVGGPDLFCTVNAIILPQNDSKWTTTVNHALCYLITTGEYQRIYDDWFKGKKAKAGFELAIPPKIRTVIENQCPFGAETWLDKKT
jgi:ABC-type amino acid transport substrate-binding protein